MSIGQQVTRAGVNWRGVVWVAVAVLAVGLGVGASVFGRAGVAPSDAERTARAFVTAWNARNYQQAYALLDTPIAGDDFVSAMQATAAPVRDARVERVVQQDERHAVIAYSATIPDALAASTSVVVANRQRFSDSCLDLNVRSSRYVRVADTLAVDRSADGTWKIVFHGANAQSSPSAIGLGYDLSPSKVFQGLSPSLDPKSAAFDEQVIADSLAIYQRDVGSLTAEDTLLTSPDAARLRVKSLVTACGVRAG
jgi:hypothetical protein